MISLSGLKCLSVGSVTHDRYEEKILPGGCAFYAASAWQSLGCSPGLVTCLGEDFQCRDFLDSFETFADVRGKTTTFVNRYDDAGNRVQYVSALGSRLVPGRVAGLASDLDVSFLAPVLGELDPLQWLDVLHARITGLGLQGLLRRASGIEGEESLKLVVPACVFPPVEMMKRIHIAFLSTEDLHGQPKELLDYLIEYTHMVVLTRGSEGSSIWWKGGQLHVPSHQAKVLDPTGAGDTYAATFLAILAASGFDVDKPVSRDEVAKAAHHASKAASIVIGDVGPLALVHSGLVIGG